MSRTSRQQVFLIAAGAAILSFVVASCEQPFTPPPSGADQPLIELKQNQLVHYDSAGKALWELTSESVKFFDTSQETQAEAIDIRFFNADGEQALEVQAQRLVYHHRSGNLAITGEMQAKDSSGIQFSTEEAFWDDERQILWSESPVRVERDDFSLTGTGFEYSPSEGTLTTHMGLLHVIIDE